MERNSGRSIVVQLYRWDRENDLDETLAQSTDPAELRLWEHSYGDAIDRLLDRLVGSAESLNRTSEWPTATVAGTEVVVELHEDGPTFQFVIEQLPAFIGATASLFSAWVTWHSARRSEANQPTLPRTTRIEIGEHKYEGPATDPKQLEAVVRALAEMQPEGDPPQRR